MSSDAKVAPASAAEPTSTQAKATDGKDVSPETETAYLLGAIVLILHGVFLLGLTETGYIDLSNTFLEEYGRWTPRFVSWLFNVCGCAFLTHMALVPAIAFSYDSIPIDEIKNRMNAIAKSGVWTSGIALGTILSFLVGAAMLVRRKPKKAGALVMLAVAIFITMSSADEVQEPPPGAAKEQEGQEGSATPAEGSAAPEPEPEKVPDKESELYTYILGGAMMILQGSAGMAMNENGAFDFSGSILEEYPPLLVWVPRGMAWLVITSGFACITYLVASPTIDFTFNWIPIIGLRRRANSLASKGVVFASVVMGTSLSMLMIASPLAKSDLKKGLGLVMVAISMFLLAAGSGTDSLPGQATTSTDDKKDKKE